MLNKVAKRTVYTHRWTIQNARTKTRSAIIYHKVRLGKEKKVKTLPPIEVNKLDLLEAHRLQAILLLKKLQNVCR